MTPGKNTNSHHREEIVSSIGVVVNAAKECRGTILANHLDDEMSTSRMFFNESRNIMNETGDENERALGSLFLERFPGDNGKFIAVGSPLKNFLGFMETLELHGQLTFADFVIGECLQVRSKAKLLSSPDEPLGRIVLIPPDGIPVVHRELMVKVVVTLSNSGESGDHVIARSVLVIEGTFTEPMSQRVDTEG